MIFYRHTHTHTHTTIHALTWRYNFGVWCAFSCVNRFLAEVQYCPLLREKKNRCCCSVFNSLPQHLHYTFDHCSILYTIICLVRNSEEKVRNLVFLIEGAHCTAIARCQLCTLWRQFHLANGDKFVVDSVCANLQCVCYFFLVRSLWCALECTTKSILPLKRTDIRKIWTKLSDWLNDNKYKNKRKHVFLLSLGEAVNKWDVRFRE